MSNGTARPFACHGGEKMIYDVRMGPVALLHNGVITIAYQANPDGLPMHPHLVTCDVSSGEWSEPVQIGEVPSYDHHFDPVLWFDPEDRTHVLFGCHGRNGGTHLISAAPGSPERWTPGPDISESISYPHAVRMAGGKLVLYYRTFGHMGYWGYRSSEDGGHTWTQPHILVDMDRDPQQGHDVWAGSYHSVWAAPDGRSLHIAFVYLDEQKRLNPLYNRRFQSKRTVNRYHLYYMRLDVASGDLYTIEGDRLHPPLNREKAEACKVWDTGHYLTNMPAIWVDGRDVPSFLLPVSGDASPWDCTFTYVRWQDGRWDRSPVAKTNSTWCGCVLYGGKGAESKAYVVSGKGDGEVLAYGGGDLEEWTSTDGGSTWRQTRVLDPEPGLLYNNPRLVEHASGGAADGALLVFGWEGPKSLCQEVTDPSQARNRGRAFLWHDGEWL